MSTDADELQSENVDPLVRIARALAIGFLLALPLFIAAAIEAGRDPQKASAMLMKLFWILGLSTYILTLPWMLVLNLFFKLPFEHSAAWVQELALGISVMLAISANAFIALRWIRFERLRIIAVIIALVQCVFVVNL